MKKLDVTWRIFGMYILIILLMMVVGTSFGQVKVVQYNAEWNKINTVEWVEDLADCKTTYVDIAKNPEIQKEHSVVVVPTIIIFNEGEEIKRYQADLSFKIVAKLEDIQEYIDELLAEDY